MAAPKVMPPILLCWPAASEANGGGNGSRGWTFLSVCHYALFLCDRWQQRSSVTKWCLIWKNVWCKGVALNSSVQKKMVSTDIHLHLPNIYGDQTVDASTMRWWVVTVTVNCLRWCRFLQVQRAGSCSSLVKMHDYWWWLYWQILFCSWEFALSNSVIVLFVLVVSTEINKRYYFQTHLHFFGGEICAHIVTAKSFSQATIYLAM